MRLMVPGSRLVEDVPLIAFTASSSLFSHYFSLPLEKELGDRVEMWEESAQREHWRVGEAEAGTMSDKRSAALTSSGGLHHHQASPGTWL